VVVIVLGACVIAHRKEIVCLEESLFSFGGRLILLKPVLTSLSVYVLSVFKALSCIISSFESMLNIFLGWV